MKKIDFLKDYEKIADIHSRRLSAAIQKTEKFFPIDPLKLSILKDDEVAFLDMMTTRFSKLQDFIGGKIFPLILDILGENALSFRDKLNVLEKLRIIDDASWWMKMREIRNQITHDYPDNYDILAKHFNQMRPFIEKLLIFWVNLKKYINQLPVD